MLEILPLQTEEEIRSACVAVGTAYNDSALVYAALLDNEPVALCQFVITDDGGEILSLSAKSDKGFDILFLLARSTLSFMELCGKNRAYFIPTDYDENLIDSIGFSKDGEGRLKIDLN